MTYQAWRARETKRIWIERLSVAAGASLLTAVFFLYVAVMFSLDALTPAVMK